MPIYEMQTPEGKSFEVEAPDINAAHEVIRSRFAATPSTPSQISAIGTGAKNAAVGALQGLADPMSGVAQLAGRAIEDFAPAGSALQRYGRENRELTDRTIKEGEAQYKQTVGDSPAASVGRFVGQAVPETAAAVLMPGAAAPRIGARVLSGMASGGAIGAVQPVTDTAPENYWDRKMGQVIEGGAGGGAVPAVMGAASRVVSPQISPEVRALMDQGVRVTPGQILGKTANRIEEGLQSVPLLGDVVQARRRAAVMDFNRAATDRALGHIGERLNPATQIGHASVAEARDKIGQAYDTLLPQLNIQVDNHLINNVRTSASAISHLDPKYTNEFHAVWNNMVAPFIQPNGAMTGDAFKRVESELGRLARDRMSSPDYGARDLGRALQQVQAEFKDLLARTNPGHAGELNAINAAYADLLRVEGAAAKPGATGGGHQMGEFTPAQLGQSVRSFDPTMRKGAFARGEARMQDLSDAGRVVLGDKVPDSGTPFRGYLGLPALLAASHADPTGLSYLPALAGTGLAAAYSRPGRSILEYGMARRPALAAPVAAAMRSPALTPLGALLAQGSLLEAPQ